jgi:hypothetical protein
MRIRAQGGAVTFREGARPSRASAACIIVTVASLCILLLGCSSQNSSPRTPGNDVRTTATPSASTSLAPAPSATATGANFCTTFLADQKAAAEAIGRAVRNPSAEEITMQDLRAARAKLQADALLAPPELRAHVEAQVATLDDFIRRLLEGSIKGLNLEAFDNAQKQVLLHCRSVG